MVVYPFATLDEHLAVIVNELSASVQDSGSRRTGGDGHYAGILQMSGKVTSENVIVKHR
jgi:hypothetical protein